MKKNILALALILGTVFTSNAQNVNIPDANFKASLVGNTFVNTNADTEIQISEAAAYNGQLNCSELLITDLTGIEAFTSMPSLHCNDNLLTSLDVSACSSLLYLYCQNNQLTSLNVSPVVRELACTNNQLTSIDLSANPILTVLFCNNNLLTSLNVANGNKEQVNPNGFNTTGNPGLTCIEVDDSYFSLANWWYIDSWTSYSNDCGGSLGCIVTIPDAIFKAYLVGNSSINTNGDSEIQCAEATSFTGSITCNNLGINDVTGLEAFTQITGLYLFMNNLTNLDVSHNTALYILNCRYNQLTSLDLSNNLNLLDVNCSHNQITALDLSTQTALTEIDCSENLLTSLNVANGNNANIINIHFMAQQNPFLTCIEVDDAAFSTSNWLNHDAGASFSEDCVLGIDEVSSIVLNVYPNPVNTILNVELKSAGTLQITNMLGEIIQTQAIQSGINSFDISNLTSGIYFIQTQNGTKTKFVKK